MREKLWITLLGRFDILGHYSQQVLNIISSIQLCCWTSFFTNSSFPLCITSVVGGRRIVKNLATSL